MKFDENLAAVHAYLCADGYVIKNPETQKQKYYTIGFRNTNLKLLKDFQNKFEKVFGTKPRLYKGQRCQKGSKEVYEILTKEFGSFYSRDWKMPSLDDRLVCIWLRAFFDCEGWVFCKTHQNRHIGVDSVNKEGLIEVSRTLNKLGIKTIWKHNRKIEMYRIFIYGKDNLRLFHEKIGFLHPEKVNKLSESLKDFVVYAWLFPENEKECRSYVISLMKERAKIKKPYMVRIISNEEQNLRSLKKQLISLYGLEEPSIKINLWINGIGTKYYELSINRLLEVQKLIKQRLISDEQLSKIRC